MAFEASVLKSRLWAVWPLICVLVEWFCCVRSKIVVIKYSQYGIYIDLFNIQIYQISLLLNTVSIHGEIIIYRYKY